MRICPFPLDLFGCRGRLELILGPQVLIFVDLLCFCFCLFSSFNTNDLKHKKIIIIIDDIRVLMNFSNVVSYLISQMLKNNTGF